MNTCYYCDSTEWNEFGMSGVFCRNVCKIHRYRLYNDFKKHIKGTAMEKWLLE